MRHLLHLIFGRRTRQRPEKKIVWLAVEVLNPRIVPSLRGRFGDQRVGTTTTTLSGIFA